MDIRDKNTILLVEDEPIIAMMGKTELEDKGYVVHHVPTGEKAVQTILDDTVPVDLILMDINLGPGMDGTQAAGQILSRKEIPVVFLSSHTERDVVEKTEKITSYGYVIKNSGTVVLDASIKMALKLFDAKTERKQAEDALKKSELQKDLILNTTLEMFAFYDLDLRIVWANKASADSVGMSQEELIGRHCHEVWQQRPIPCEECPVLLARETGEPQTREMTSLDGRAWSLRGYPVFDDQGEVINLIELGLDVTAQKKAEQALKAGRDLLNATQRIARVGGWEWDAAEDRVTWSEELYRIAGLDPDSPPPPFYGGHRRIYTKESWQKLAAAVDHALKTGDPYEFFAQIIRPGGEIRDVSIYGGARVNDSGSVHGLFGIVEDITEKNQRERLLRKSEEDLRITLNSIGDAVISTDIEGRVIRMNPVAEKLCGWRIREAEGKALEEVFVIVNAITGKKAENPVARVLDTGKIVGLANHTMLISREGNEFQIADSAAPILDDYGNTTGVVLVFRDVTTEYGMAQALAESERGMARAQEMARLGSWRIDMNSRKVIASDQARRIYGLEEGELTMEDVQSMALPQYRPMLDAALKALIEEGKPYDVEFQVRRRTDEQVRIVHSAAEYDPDSRLVTGMIQDITEGVISEQKLRESEEKYRLLHENAGIGIGYYTPEGVVISYNRLAASHMNGVPEDFAGRSLYELFPEREAALYHDRIKKACLTDHPTVYEDLVSLPTGNRHFLSTFTTITNTAKDILGIQIISQEITELKQAENQIRHQLSEKETLLREVHHRVKNNIAQIEGFLFLQSSSVANPEARAALQDAVSRIQGMRVLYEKLLLSKSHGDVSVKGYAEALLDASARVFDSQRTVKIESFFEDFVLEAKKAVSVGIVINELLTNVFKYAFKDREDGLVSISIRKEVRRVILIVQDNGVGMDERIAADRSPGFGLTIVRMLVEQLDGTYSRVSENGTKTIITFEL